MLVSGGRMDLKEYLYQKRMTITQFGELIDFSRTHLSQVMNGNLKAGRKLVRAIEKATNGEVKASEIASLRKETQEGESHG